MKTNSKSLLDKLLNEGKLKKQGTDVRYLNSLLNSTHQNLLSAKYNLEGGFLETAFKSAYDGLLQISRVVLLLNGYRPDDGEQHKTTFLATEIILGGNLKELIERIDRYRIKRNKAVYQPVDFISKNEAIGIIDSAKEYWLAVRDYLKEKNNQLELFDL